MTNTINIDELSELLKGYAACLLWVAPEDEKGKNLDEYGIIDIDEDTLKKMKEEVEEFKEENEDLFLKVNMSDEQIGHDFALTRNHHGTGFWDRGFGQDGNILSERCDKWGEYNLYAGDDGKVYSL